MAGLSVLTPYSFPEIANPVTATSGGSLAVMIAQLAGMLPIGIGLIPVAALTLALVFMASAWSGPVLPVGIAYGLAAGWSSARTAGNCLDRRRPETLAAITPGRG